MDSQPKIHYHEFHYKMRRPAIFLKTILLNGREIISNDAELPSFGDHHPKNVVMRHLKPGDH